MGDTSAVTGAAKSIASALAKEGDYLYGVEDQFRALRRDLVCMQQFLQDVDANPNLLKQDGQLRILTFEMQELAFRAEDAIDTYLVDVGSKIFNKNFLLKIVCLAFHAYPVHMLRKEIEAIQQEAKDAMTRSENFKKSFPATSQLQGDYSGSSNSKPIAENYIHLNDEFFVGIEDDITYLVNRLTDKHDDFQVLGIVGTGGAGKSTLVSQIYRHTKIESSFSHRAFISVSQQWSKFDLLCRISKEILGQSKISSSERELVKELHDFMKEKQCLVILDDIWKKEAWDDVHHIFPRTQGLRVVLTTRIEEVPRHADTKCVLHKPNMLTNNLMWALFSKLALEGRRGIENNIIFEKLGKEMLKKCHGLPLAVVTLACLLRTKQHSFEWEGVNQSLNEKILEEKGGSTYGVVEEMLELSYLDLPTHLKPLFLYLAIIPEDQVWSSKELINMWIAEGFLVDDQTRRCGSLEDKAMQLMSDLAQRNIIQVRQRNYRGEVAFLNLHDLMREFCIKKASECQFLENISPTCTYGRRPNKARRLSIFSREHCLEENNFLRTIVYQGLSNWESDGKVIRNLESIHTDFKLLRVLRIVNCANKILPNQIGNLIHLTYLSIFNTNITELPESVRNLSKLIYLEFSPPYGAETQKVPDDLVENMQNLRVLDLHAVESERLGISSERHKKLQKISCGAGGWMAKDLPLMHLLTLTSLSFINIKETEELEAINQCMAFFKDSLQIFICKFTDVDPYGTLCRFDIEKLMGHKSLHTLHLYGRLGNNHPIQFPPNLEILILSDTYIGEEVDLMGVLGQLSKLKHLGLRGSAYMGTQIRCSGTSFPQLEMFVSDLCCLEEWILDEGGMACLETLKLLGGVRLERLPPAIRFISTLKKVTFDLMSAVFFHTLGHATYLGRDVPLGEDLYIIQHIPSVTFWNYL